MSGTGKHPSIVRRGPDQLVFWPLLGYRTYGGPDIQILLILTPASAFSP